MKKEVHVGVYVLDGMKFDLVLTSGMAGSFWWPTSRGSIIERPKCEIGADLPWHGVVKVFIHELFEASCMEHGCLFEKTMWLTDTSSGRHIIHCDHAKFSMICDSVGDILTYALKPLRVAWMKRNRK